MSEESLIFSVLGLTVRGFHCNADKWVPKGGQRLSCALRSGAIDVLKDDQSVGKVATEAPNKFKDWVKADGTIEAVVIGLPKKHRGKKGEEVPVMFVFRSKKDYRMIKFKKAITSGISKLRKKSTKVVDGDASEEMTFSDTDENQFEFSVRGMTMRGFHVYNKLWVPEIGDRILCSVNDDHSVEMVKDGQTIGHVQTEGQALFRKFIKAKGVIHAVVNAEPKQHRSKGEEIPVIYQFSADDWTNRLQNIRNEIRNDIKKGSEKKKSLKFIRSNEESQNEAGPSYETQSMDRAGTSGENKFSTKVSEQMKSSNEKLVDDMEDISAVNNESHPENTENGEGEKISDRKNSSGQVKKSRKRRADERTGGSVEKIPKTETIQKIKRSAKNEKTTEKLPDAEASRNTTQLPKKEKNTTAEHLLETKIVLKTETTEGTKKQPKTKKAQQSGSGKQESITHQKYM
ncbi:uncharacterized protein LOC123534505 [Mercenaria mercenaria]|uniref:uncharacterized protein LOC123534505 n=1 Tax=Mercenaria mercenaria TaxID=6596 RepID=UPI00234E9EC6|nr:uncharacterized protein LOC123534505 [Mercenaria mercenaria]